MTKKQNGSIIIYFFLILIFLLSGCAAKKISPHIYPQTDPAIRGQIIMQAIELLGKPYRGGAKGPESFDCSGLVHFVYRNNGLLLPPVVESLLTIGSEIENNDVQPGDLVFFRIKRNHHVGIMINTRQFIHASTKRGVVIDDVNLKYWKDHFLSFRSII